MATPIIFPSLSKAPTLDSSMKTADDTIRDSMDLGYVATRPRFTRGRRTWPLNVRNLQLEDVRALDVFTEQTVQRGGLSFYYPNLAPNGSFEFPAQWPDEIVHGWTVSVTQGISIQPITSAADGLTAIQFATIAGSLAPAAVISAQLQSAVAFPVIPGETYTGVFEWSGALDGFLGGLGGFYSGSANLALRLQMSDGSAVTIGPAVSNSLFGLALPAAYTALAQTFTIPAPSGGLVILGAQVVIQVFLQNTGTVAASISAPGSINSFYVNFDSIGMALTQPAPGYSIYGRMAGSSSLARPVRFAASKLPEFSDLGWVNGAKAYGTTFTLEEV